eukprot:Phypoly_transcript_01362.p1 GENE.Phypoly_transcript_01362~~Phypoly_transcript_01362.p1  ORF type:complete len:840 (+),score=175.37 Phypoly_transcript_01362:739-3258(+)
MEGYADMEGRGLIPRAIEEIYDYIANPASSSSQFLVRASYLQIYNEEISDLLKPERKHLAIREDKKRGVFVEGLSEWVVRSPGEVYRLMEQGSNQRATSSTRLNELSSRSHAVFMLIAEQSEVVVSEENEENTMKTFKIGKLNLVDLAGSERVRVSGSTGKRLEESKKINQSLSALGNVIAALTDPKGRPHIPYRDSKLTRLLEDSLGGNCLTTMLAMVSPALESFFETLSTLKFANRAKAIKNKAKINEDLDQKALLQKYEMELKKLRRELAEKSRVVGDTRNWLKMQEDMQRAEHDKILILKELEDKSREFMREKEEKRKLEQRIQQMQNQVIPGGASPAAVLKIQKEYEQKMSELERERQSIEEDKQQVDRYKGLLLKQRDIMIVLTAKLNERDQSIITQKEELEGLKKHIGSLEDSLDQKTAQIFHLQRLTAEHEKRSPDLKDSGNKRHSSQFSDPKKLVTTKQYPPFAPSTVVELPMDKLGNIINQSPDIDMLSAEEKIEELSSLLQQKSATLEKMEQDLLEVQTEKVSLESLLREKLEGIIKPDTDHRTGTSGKRRDKEDHQESTGKSRNSITPRASVSPTSPSTSPKSRTRKAAHASKVLSMVSSMLNTTDPYEVITQLQAELNQKEEERRRAVEDLETYQQQVQFGPPHEVAANGTNKAKRERTDDERVRHTVLEKDERIRQLDEDNQSLQILLQKAGEDQEAERDEHARQINQLIRDRQVEEALWREEKQSAMREVLALKKLCAVTAKERVTLHNFMEQRVKVTLDNLYRMVNNPDFDPDAFVHTIHTLQRHVQDATYALASSSMEEDFAENPTPPHPHNNSAQMEAQHP